jgi:dihydrofolate reductase
MAPAASRRKEKSETTNAPSTRNVVLAVAVSLDGYIARSNGSVDWLIMDPTIDLGAYGKAFDVIVAGRKTLDIEQPSGGGGGPFSKMACYIFSRTKPPGKHGRAEYVNRSPGEFVRDLKALPGKDIWLMGGGELAREFLKEDLVDGMDLGIIPVLLGEGIPLFPSGFPQRNFTLVSHRAHPSGIVRAVYARAEAQRSQTK